MTSEQIVALADAAATLLTTVAQLKATADASTQAEVDAALSTAVAQFNADATTAEADLLAAG